MFLRVTTTSVPAVLLTAIFLWLFSEQPVGAAPNGPHCISSGPISLPIDYCGCTWGGVYYRETAIENVPITLTFATQKAYTVTLNRVAEPFPFYVTEGYFLGASLNDEMTVTTQIAGQTVSRSFRARPDNNREQEIPLIIPEEGVWLPWLSQGYTHALATQNTILWAGGPAGLIAIDLVNAITTTHSLPWSEPTVVAIVVGANGRVWAAGPHNLAEYDGATWQNRALPFSTTLRAMTSNPTTGALWVAGWESKNGPGLLAVYTETWQVVSAITRVITTLAVDHEGDVWAGTSSNGVYRRDHMVADVNAGWTQYTRADGLASNQINDIAVSKNNIWFATEPQNVNGQPLGGVSRYEPATGTWRTFTPNHGLPVDTGDPQYYGPVYAITASKDGRVWVGTTTRINGVATDAIYTLITPELWVQDITMSSNRISDLAVVNDFVMAVGDNHGMKLDRRTVPGQPPTVQLHTTLLTITLDTTLLMTATANDNDEDGGQIRGWEWRSAQAGHLCTTAKQCVVPGQLLGEGVHQIQLRVQDDEGVWSSPAQVTVAVVSPAPPQNLVYLPILIR